MGNIIMLTGGARSGKSMHAQRIAAGFRDVAYVATAMGLDTEMQLRIEKHKQARPPHWKTYEEPYDLVPVLRSHRHEAYLIDCITVYLTNLLLRQKTDWNEQEVLAPEEQAILEEAADRKIGELLQFAAQSDSQFIIVTNEVGMGLVPASSLGRLFRDVAGRANRKLAEQAQTVYLVVSGLLLPLKGQV